jgi:DNA-binding protein H-NS
MATTYTQLLKQIATLQTQAEGLKRAEIADAIAKAKVAIQAYGLTPQDLFSSKPAKAAKAAKAAKPKKARNAEVKYADGKGGVWVGRGKRPQWLSSALAAGAKLEDFLAAKFAEAVAAVTPDAEPAPAPAPAAEAAAAPAPTKKKAAPRKPAAKKAAAKPAAN